MGPGRNRAHISKSPVSLVEGEDKSLDIELVPSKNARITVQDGATRKPIPQARVVVESAQSHLLHRTETTDDSGVALFTGLPAGSYRATAQAQGYIQRESVDLQPGAQLLVELEPGATISGSVRTPEGQPIEGASLIVNQDLGDPWLCFPRARA